MMRSGTLRAALLALLALPVAALAQPTETGETGLITMPNTKTLLPGKLNLGAYVRYDVIEGNKHFETARAGGGIADTDLMLASAVLGIGIIEGLELSVQVPWVNFQNDQAREEDNHPTDLGNVRITPKFTLFNEETSAMPFGLAFLGSVALPSGNDRFPAPLDRNTLFNEEVSWEVMGILDKNLFTLPGDVPVVLSLNAGGLFPGEPDVFRLDRQNEQVFAQLRRKGFPPVKVEDAVFQYGAGLELPLWKDNIGQLNQLTEFRGNTGTIDEIDEFRSILAGLRYMLVNGWALSAGMDFGLTNSLEQYTLVVGITWTGPQPESAMAGAKERVVYRDRVIQVEKVQFGDITFDFDKATLTDVGRGRVYLIAQKLKEGKNIKVEIQGHTDYIGTEEYNKALGLRRAETVKSELVKLGVSPAEMSTVSYGESKPLIDLQTPWARAVNRRSEFVIESESDTSPRESTTKRGGSSAPSRGDESE